MSSPEAGTGAGAGLADGGAGVIDLVVVGDANPDVLVIGDDVTPEFGQKEKLVRAGSLTVGGSAAITAVAAARLGSRWPWWPRSGRTPRASSCAVS